MTADEHAAEAEALRRRFPGWTVWYGPYTRHWWALPPRGSAARGFVEAATPRHLIASIEGGRPPAAPPPRAARLPDQASGRVPARPSAQPRRDARHPSNLLRVEGAAPSPSPRVPVVAWPGGAWR